MRRLVVLSLAAMLFIPLPALALKPCIPPNLQMLRGVWIGQGDMGGYARLEITPSGRGVLAIEEAFGERPISIYRISEINISDYNFTLTVKPVRNSTPTKATGEYKCSVKLFRQVLNRNQAVETYLLEQENYVVPRIRSVQRAMGARSI